MNALIRLLYALLVAGAVVTFVGFGIFSLYQSPKYPQYPNYGYSNDTATYEAQQKDYNKQMDVYRKKEKTYQRNVTYIVLPLAIAFVIGGLILFRKSDVVGEGVALGGIGTSIYAIITSSLASARALRFLAVTILLASVLLLTYRRFYSKEPKRS